MNLYAPDGSLVDSVGFREQVQNVSYGRQPDGSNDWCYFSEPTPVEPNSTECATGLADIPKVSVKAGFFDGPLKVKLTAPDKSKLYYTLDGSLPTKDSRHYSKPLVIEETKVLRVRAFKNGLIPSEILTRTFFIDQTHSLPVLSLITDPANLWDEYTGIYTEGRYPVQPNYFQTGKDWERPATLEFYEEDRTLGFAIDAGIRIHGGATRVFPKKSFRIYFRKRYGEEILDYSIFTEKKFDKSELDAFHKLIIRNIGNDGYGSRPRLRDPIMHALWGELGGVISAKRSIFLYLNGEPWGIYNIRELIDQHYLASNYNVEDADLIKATARLVEGDLSHW